MSDAHSPQHAPDQAATTAAPARGAKAPWHAPTMEEVDYSATEATGVGGVYDFVVYSGSTGP
jgi:hypothetical protein